MRNNNFKSRVMGSILLLFLLVGYENCGGNAAFTTVPPQSANATGSGVVDPGTHQVQQVLALGVMTKNMDCVMCHTTVQGDMSGFGTMSFRADSMGKVVGNIYAADQKLYANGMPANYQDTTTDPNLVAKVLPELISFNLATSSSGAYSILPGEQHNAFAGSPGFSGGGFGNMVFSNGSAMFTLTSSDSTVRATAQSHIIMNPFTNSAIIHDSDFPQLNPLGYASQATGTVTLSNGRVLQSPINGNTILVNGQNIVNPNINAAANSYNNYDPSCPSGNVLRISGQILVKGDLILAGCITGQGTIYASGNIYVPDDIKMVNSGFPYPQTTDAPTLQAAATAAASKDMLSLGSAQFIIIGDIDYGVANNGLEDPIFANNNAMLANVDNWLSIGNAAQNQALYVNSFLKRTFWTTDNNPYTATNGAVAFVESNLYANMGVTAVRAGSTESNQIINGSVMTPNLLMLSVGFSYIHYDAAGNTLSVNPFNGLNYANDYSQLNQDFRLKYTNLGYELLRVKTTTVANNSQKVQVASVAATAKQNSYVAPRKSTYIVPDNYNAR